MKAICNKTLSYINKGDVVEIYDRNKSSTTVIADGDRWHTIMNDTFSKDYDIIDGDIEKFIPDKQMRINNIGKLTYEIIKLELQKEEIENKLEAKKLELQANAIMLKRMESGK